MNFKQKIVRIFFMMEIFLVVGLFIFGTQGLLAYRQLQQEVQHFGGEIELLSQEIQKLEQECDAWRNDPFYVEQCAREKLAMAQDGEQVYVVK